ncbi:hypothetical protein BZL30_5367 [Mycobacterium kansasii]|uniref:Uncharacterized protein n=1 Tax=Mycobacterium kansasii TaxID=1768 RepID=A0A1V3WYQ8_MYCKA|nr:hypothetical protein BZL30_5367 [Mycobacterium kansasii]
MSAGRGRAKSRQLARLSTLAIAVTFRAVLAVSVRCGDPPVRPMAFRDRL